MKCPVCNSPDPETMVLLPVSVEPDKSSFIVCLGCAEKTPHYCKKHERPHSGFVGDTSTACLLCVEDLVAEKASKADALEKALYAVLPVSEAQELADAASFSSDITSQPVAMSILRFLATKALRTGATVEVVAEKVIEDRSANYILRLF